MENYGHDNPPPGYAPCTRAAGHEGPCAMPFAKKNDVMDRARSWLMEYSSDECWLDASSEHVLFGLTAFLMEERDDAIRKTHEFYERQKSGKDVP